MTMNDSESIGFDTPSRWRIQGKLLIILPELSNE